jgi:hypothetical protein
MKITKGYALKLIWDGLKNKQIFLADAGFSLLVLSKPLLLLAALLMVAMSWLNIIGFQAGSAPFVWGLFLLLAQLGYLALGVALGGLDKQRMMYVTLLGLVGYRANAWVRTKRSCER